MFERRKIQRTSATAAELASWKEGTKKKRGLFEKPNMNSRRIPTPLRQNGGCKSCRKKRPI